MQLSEAAISELEAICPGGVMRNVDLSKLSRWRIGGNSDLFLEPSSPEELSRIVRWFDSNGIAPVVVGLTTNLLFDDAGLRAPCIQIGRRMSQVEVRRTTVVAQAGAWVPGLARTLMTAGLGGAEHTCGIPGALGGLICMNGGSQRKGIGSNLVTVQSVDRKGQVLSRTADECDFKYRESIFQRNGEIITSCVLAFSSRDPDEIRAEMLKILTERRKKFPRKEPNCGSVFRSNPKMYAEIGPPGAAIERLGFKGYRIGDAMVSPKHANFIVNKGEAKARDVIRMIFEIRQAVQEATGYRMEAEACFVSSSGKIVPADSVFCTEDAESFST